MFFVLKVKFTATQDLAILPASDGTVILFIFGVFSFQIICFTFFISSIFSNGMFIVTVFKNKKTNLCNCVIMHQEE